MQVQVKHVAEVLHLLTRVLNGGGKGLSTGLGSKNSGLLILVLTLAFVTFGSSFYDSVSVPGLGFKKEST